MSNSLEDDFPWHFGVFDAHCHPTDIMSSIDALPSMNARCLTVMGTRAQDQHLVAQVADKYGVKNPTPFSDFLAQTRRNLEKYPFALVGEIGLDRSFRIPEANPGDREDNELTPGGREGRRLTPFRCAPAHQKEIFKRQLQLAAELDRGVSLHGVQAHGLVFSTIKELWQEHQLPVLSKRERKKRETDGPSVTSHVSSQGADNDKPRPFPPRICLHSYSGSPDAFKQYLSPSIPVSFFASFSTAINLGNDLEGETPEAFVQMIETVPDDMLLVESDLHTAGAEMDERLEDMVRRICVIKGWGLDEGVRRLGDNWKRFVFGEG
ncbi:Metallo-dependent hydrolase [Paraphaeosphaeria sporulosa]|uniref:Metallo-dependent hydrolase n=1 Tax=Paraphaeosphaeria sporulosa TaxID=1460663 RepID=A0A177CEG0_9PLEO|nr:Metallo-dependent hydrolase [Paraphaeosphaeria sporulosa]OAG06023.1 Metallo-dependent hydrolase [Paraphaeosphaeria sporulosa]